MFPINQINPYARAQVPSNNIVWVQGIEGAKAQQITPGSTLLLLDSEQDRFYIKACDQYGICMPLKAFEFKAIVETPAAPFPTVDAQAGVAAQYVTIDELNSFKEEITNLVKELKESNEQPISDNAAGTKYTAIPTGK